MMRFDDKSQWPYPKSVYLKRLMWRVVRNTVWLLCWRRWYRLRAWILRGFGARTGRRINVAGSVCIEMPWALEIGEESTLGERVKVYNLDTVRIGSRTVISQDVSICGGTHDYTDPVFPLVRKPVTIGDDVWIGAEAFICPGVRIGDGAVVGARAIVTRDVEPWTVVAGNPAKFLKKRELREKT